MTDVLNRRKQEHLRVIRDDPDVERRKYYFDDIRLVHRALPDINLRDIDTTCTFLEKPLSFPLLVSCMTGGAGDFAHNDLRMGFDAPSEWAFTHAQIVVNKSIARLHPRQLPNLG